MSDERERSHTIEEPCECADDVVRARRDFLIGLGRWSRVVITGAVLGVGAVMPERPAQAGWLNRRGAGGAGWLNNRGGGGWWNNRGGLGWLNVR